MITEGDPKDQRTNWDNRQARGPERTLTQGGLYTEGITRRADAQDTGIVLMRPVTGGVFQRLMVEAFPQVDVLDVGKLLLPYVLSDPYVDVVLIGMREPRFVDLNNAISDNVDSRFDLAQVHEQYVR